MADDLIDILVRLRGGNLAAAEARKVARAVDDIGDEAEGADRKIEGLNRSMLAAQSSKVAGGFGDTINNMSGRLKLLGGAAVVTAPALIGLGSSLAAAAGGAALLGGAGAGALGVGLGGVVGIAKSAADGWKKVKTALDAYRLSVAQNGRTSKEAATAQKHLNAVVSQFGGKPVLQAIRGVDRLKAAWKSQTGVARAALGSTFRDAISAATRLIPTYADVTNRSATAVQKALGRMFRSFSGPEARGTLSAFGATFVRIIGPLSRGFTDLGWAIIRAFRVALPYVVKVADGFARWARGLRDSTSNGSGLISFVGSLMASFRAWWGLIKAVGRVLGALFLSSKASGDSLVGSLTGVLNKFADWINKARAAGSASAFFNGWAQVLKGVVGGVGVAIKIAYFAAQPFVALLIWAAPAIKPLIGIFFSLWLALKAFRTGMALARLAMLAFPGGWIIAAIGLVIAAVVLMWTKWAWFRNAVKGVWAWLKTAASDTAGWISQAFRDSIQWIENAVRNIKSAIRDTKTFLGLQKGSNGGGLANALGFSKIRGALGLGQSHRAAGGPVKAGRPYVVGERRPELFVPSQDGKIVPQVPAAHGAAAAPQRLHLMLTDQTGKTLAEWMVRNVQDAQARS